MFGSPIVAAFNYFVMALCVIAFVVVVSVLVQRRVKHRREYAGPTATAEEVAYAASGPSRAIQVALVSAYGGRAGTELAVAVAETVLAGRLGGDLVTAAVRAALDRVAESARTKDLLDPSGSRTASDDALLKDLRHEHGQLWPGYKPDWAALTAEQRTWAVAIYGTRALEGIDLELAAVFPVPD